jgi:glucose-6-phosphate dehydrogenase assembly protein OpcA
MIGTPAPGWAFEEAPPPRIEEVLERQRLEQEDDGHGPLMRASVNNMVVVTRSRSAGQRALATIESLGARAPSRCVVLIADPPSERQRVRSWARVAHHRHAEGGSEVIWEEVIVQTNVEPRHLPAVVLPLLLPELPVFTYWEGTPPFSDEVFDELSSVTDRLIVDSASFTDQPADLARLAQAAQVLRPALSDCVWARLTAWRELLADPFNGPPLRGTAWRARRLTVEAVDLAAGFQLTGWLASRLDWRLEEAYGSDDLYTARYRTRTGECNARIASTLGSASLTRVELAVGTDDGEATVRVEATPSHLLTTVRAPGHPTARRFGVGSEHNPLAAELEVFGRERVFEAALVPAAELAEAGAE